MAAFYHLLQPQVDIELDSRVFMTIAAKGELHVIAW